MSGIYEPAEALSKPSKDERDAALESLAAGT